MPAPARPQKITRARMEEHIRDGGSVMLANGDIVTDLAALPSEADLAAGDAERLAQALEVQQAQQAAATAELARLQKAHAEARQKAERRQTQAVQQAPQSPPQEQPVEGQGGLPAADVPHPRAEVPAAAPAAEEDEGKPKRWGKR